MCTIRAEKLVKTIFDDVQEIGVYTYEVDMTGVSGNHFVFRLCNLNGICSEGNLVR
jgi:hypothetical protein